MVPRSASVDNTKTIVNKARQTIKSFFFNFKRNKSTSFLDGNDAKRRQFGSNNVIYGFTGDLSHVINNDDDSDDDDEQENGKGDDAANEAIERRLSSSPAKRLSSFFRRPSRKL